MRSCFILNNLHNIKVGWIIALPRFGSSPTAYAAAAPWDFPVADEIFGPADRTDAPYYYPPEQVDLIRLSRGGLMMSDNVASLANTVLQKIARDAQFVVCKSPHLNPTPEEIARFFPHHRTVMLMRNPLHRVNSYLLRGTPFLDKFGPYEIEFFKIYARLWLNFPNRVLYDDLKRDPRRYFLKIYEGWGVECMDEDISKAIAYQKNHYHDFCVEETDDDPESVRSETELRLPDEAIEIYLNDPFTNDLMRQMGWSVNPQDYKS
jgi:hypothetical protein